jgi:hypothetical protein
MNLKKVKIHRSKCSKSIDSMRWVRPRTREKMAFSESLETKKCFSTGQKPTPAKSWSRMTKDYFRRCDRSFTIAQTHVFSTSLLISGNSKPISPQNGSLLRSQRMYVCIRVKKEVPLYKLMAHAHANQYLFPSSWRTLTPKWRI